MTPLAFSYLKAPFFCFTPCARINMKAKAFEPVGCDVSHHNHLVSERRPRIPTSIPTTIINIVAQTIRRSPKVNCVSLRLRSTIFRQARMQKAMPPMYMTIDPIVATRESDVTRRAKSLAIFSIMTASFDNKGPKGACCHSLHVLRFLCCPVQS